MAPSFQPLGVREPQAGDHNGRRHAVVSGRPQRDIGTVCVPCVDGKMAQAPSPRSATATTKCELVHTDIGGPLTESLGSSIYFMTALEDSTGFITAQPIKTKGMAPQILKTRYKQLGTLTGSRSSASVMTVPTGTSPTTLKHSTRTRVSRRR